MPFLEGMCEEESRPLRCKKRGKTLLVRLKF